LGYQKFVKKNFCCRKTCVEKCKFWGWNPHSSKI